MLNVATLNRIQCICEKKYALLTCYVRTKLCQKCFLKGLKEEEGYFDEE